MRCHAAAALAGLLGCWCAAALAQEPAPDATALAQPLLRVAWIERASLDPFAFARMEEEARAVLERLGLRLRLRRRQPLEDDGEELRVVLSDQFAPDDRMIMGALVVPYSARTRARIWIFQPAVRSVAALGSCPPAAQLREGVALGRILAHEIVHALAPGLGHADEGLMARKLSNADFDSPVTIDAETIAAMREAATTLEARAWAVCQ